MILFNHFFLLFTGLSNKNISNQQQKLLSSSLSSSSSLFATPLNTVQVSSSTIAATRTIANKNESSKQSQEIIKSFLNEMNKLQSNKEIDKNVMKYFDENVEFIDTAFYNPIQGKDNLLRHFLLFRNSDVTALSLQNNMKKKQQQKRGARALGDVKRNIVIDDIVSGLDTYDDETKNENQQQQDIVCVQYHVEQIDGGIIPDTLGMTFYTLCGNKIIRVFDVLEPPSPKPGDAGLKLLNNASKILKLLNLDNANDDDSNVVSSTKQNMAEKEFQAWNERKMTKISEYYTDDCIYKDLQYPNVFNGKETVKNHYDNVATCLPNSFRFKIDSMVTMPTSSSAGFLPNFFPLPNNNKDEKIGLQWHVESNGQVLPFTRGLSIYTTDNTDNLIQTAVSIPEPAVIKPGIFNLISNQFKNEPSRIIPAFIWIMYMYIVFFSDGILPGANALTLEQRTWEEVRDLSLNFFLVSPVLNLPFAPTVHPMLEGVFNLLLAWAGLFAGFLSDERKDKPNILPFGPIVIGMQFLTSAFLLPYLALRTSEVDFDDSDNERSIVYREDISGSIQPLVSEWKPLAPFLGSVGISSIVWAFIARPEFGNLNERYASFCDLLSIDRVGSSFLVDLAIFALFQGSFVDDDMKRRGVKSDEMVLLKNVAKYVPFFGLACYLNFRPVLPSKDE